MGPHSTKNAQKVLFKYTATTSLPLSKYKHIIKT